MAYSIKAASALLEVPADTLRKWERRYRLVAPRRGGNAYRGYETADLRRLAAFARARAEGKPGAEAARLGAAAAGEGRAKGGELLRREAGRAIESFDRDGLSRLCARAEAEHGRPGALSAVWIPLLRALGERALRAGGLAIAQEHFAVSVLRERMPAPAPVPGRPAVALAAPEGELHELGMLALRHELRRRGLNCLYLGPNMPVESLRAALDRARVSAVILCVTRRIERPAVRALVRAIRRGRPGARVCLGGAASLPHANLVEELGGVFLGDDLRLGLDKLERRLGRRDGTIA